jgi:germination protein YpeB
MAEIDGATAVEKVKSLLGADEAYLVGITHGKADAYEIEGKSGGEEIYTLVSKKGGLIISYDRAREVMGVTLSEQSAVRLAEEKISGLGYDGLSPVWYNASGGIAMVTLAPRVDGVTYYPDLVKVKLALDDGTLLGVEAAGYCASHRSRSYTPSVDEGTVRALISDKLSVESISLAVIPSACGEKEYFCYEAVGEYKGLRYYAYLDAVTGEQRQILRVVETDQGEMVV